MATKSFLLPLLRRSHVHNSSISTSHFSSFVCKRRDVDAVPQSLQEHGRVRFLTSSAVALDDGAKEKSSVVPMDPQSVKEALSIGYEVVGRVASADFGQIRQHKAFAVVQVGSHQFKVSPGDCIYTEKLKYADINDKLRLEKVLLLGSRSQTIIGRPVVPKAQVHAAVEEHALDAKDIIFKKKRRKNYRRTRGHRQELTRLRILDVRGLGEDHSIN